MAKVEKDSGKKNVDKADAKAKKEGAEAKTAMKGAKKEGNEANKAIRKAVKEGTEAIGAKANADMKKLVYKVGQIIKVPNGRGGFTRAKVQPNGQWRFIKSGEKK